VFVNWKTPTKYKIKGYPKKHMEEKLRSQHYDNTTVTTIVK